MIYNEVHIGTATTVNELIKLLNDDRIPLEANVDIAISCYISDAEVW